MPEPGTATAPAPPAAPAPARAPRRPSPALRRRIAENTVAYAFLSGAILCFALFSWYPITSGVALAFQQVNFVTDPVWVGLENFRTLFRDPLFATAWANTARFTLLALVFGFALPFVLALVLNELKHARGYLRLVVYLPVMLPPIVSALLWKWFYDPGPGLLNGALRAVGLPGLEWTNSADTALVSLVIVSTWANLGTATLIYLAGLQAIPGELYEAAELDGAGLLQRVWSVTVPHMRFVILVLLLLQIVATMQVFVEPYILTGGGPEGATTTVLLLIYRYAFTFGDFGAAAALSLLLFAVLAVFSALYLWATRTR